MKVLMTADTVGGVWTYALDLADALAAQGFEVELATMGRAPDGDQRADAGRTAVAALHESTLALEWEDDPWDDVDRAGRWLLELEERVRPDLVHLNGYAHASLPWSVPVVVAAHSDVLSWWQAVRREPAPSVWNRYRAAVEAGLRAADLVVAPTHAVLADLARHYSFPTETLVVSNGRRWDRPRSGKKPFVLGLGRFWDEAKNVSALERVRGRTPWPVIVAGPGSPVGRLSREAVDDHLARAAVFASPARYEPFGLTILEAALAGCALVLGDIESLREVWGDAALYVPPDDHDALVRAFRLLAADADLLMDLAYRGLRRAQRHTPGRMAVGYAGAYVRVLERAAVAA
jgi:glycosyltransferase involved in cell wall biosynthesis